MSNLTAALLFGVLVILGLCLIVAVNRACTPADASPNICAICPCGCTQTGLCGCP